MTDAAPLAFEFDRATALHATAEDRWSFEVDAGFTVGGKPNGGYLVAVAARAAEAALVAAGTEHRHPLASTTHFLAAPDAGPAEVQVTVLRAGRSASQVRTAIAQDGRLQVEATFTMGTLPDDGEPASWSAVPPPPTAAIADCTRLPARREGAPFEVAIMDRADVRLDPDTLGFAVGAPSGRGELRGWVSFGDGRPADPAGLLFFLDCLPPATFDIGRSGWVPTLSLTTYLRAVPAPGPLLVRQRALVVHAGRVDEVCELWDRAGRLVGQATQLAGIRFEDDTALAPHPA